MDVGFQLPWVYIPRSRITESYIKLYVFEELPVFHWSWKTLHFTDDKTASFSSPTLVYPLLSGFFPQCPIKRLSLRAWVQGPLLQAWEQRGAWGFLHCDNTHWSQGRGAKCRRACKRDNTPYTEINKQKANNKGFPVQQQFPNGRKPWANPGTKATLSQICNTDTWLLWLQPWQITTTNNNKTAVSHPAQITCKLINLGGVSSPQTSVVLPAWRASPPALIACAFLFLVRVPRISVLSCPTGHWQPLAPQHPPSSGFRSHHLQSSHRALGPGHAPWTSWGTSGTWRAPYCTFLSGGNWLKWIHVG